MAIGSYLKYLHENSRIKYMYRLVMGANDFHTHIRLRPVVKLCKKNYFLQKKIIEIGCGEGAVAFEILSHTKGDFSYTGIDMNQSSIDAAIVMEKKIDKKKKLNFVCVNAFEYIDKMPKKDIDIIIFYDFLEHIPDPESFINELMARIKNKNVIFLVSVPTPRYPEVFGREFHNKIGHIVDGYTLQDLDSIFSCINAKRIAHNFNTGVSGNIGARLYYLYCKAWNEAWKEIITKPFLLFDFNGARISSSIFAVYKIRN